MPLKINDSMENQEKRFKSIKHTPDHINCIRCRTDKAEKSIPKKEWKVKDNKGNDVTVSEITIKRGSLDDCIGWSYSW